MADTGVTKLNGHWRERDIQIIIFALMGPWPIHPHPRRSASNPLSLFPLDFRPFLLTLTNSKWPGLATGVTPAAFMTAGRSLT